MENKDRSDSDQSNEQHAIVEQSVLNKYQLIEKIGSGAYGHVWKAKNLKTGKTHAIKKVFLAFQNSVDSQRIYRQISLLAQLKHDNVVNLYEVIPSQKTDDIYLIFQNMDSDLFKAIKNRVLDQLHKKYIVYQLALSLDYLHSSGLIHRDIKPSNILLNSNCNIKICDFGLARTIKSKLFQYQNPIMTQFMATRWYRSPEILFGSRQYGTKADMWSLGCLIYELYSRRTLMPGQSTVDQIVKLFQFKGMPNQEQIKSFKAPKSIEIIAHFNQIHKKPLQEYFDDLQNQQVKQLILNLLEYDQNKRMTAKEMLRCKFLSEFKHMPIQSTQIKSIYLDIDDNNKMTSNRYKQEIFIRFAKLPGTLHPLKNSLDKLSKKQFSSLHASPTKNSSNSRQASQEHKYIRNSAQTTHFQSRSKNPTPITIPSKSRLDLSQRPTYRFSVNNSSEHRNSTGYLRGSLHKQVLKNKVIKTHLKNVSPTQKSIICERKYIPSKQNQLKEKKKLKKQINTIFIKNEH